MSEELTLEQSWDQSAAVNRNKWTLTPGTIKVNRSCYQFLTGSAFSKDEHRMDVSRYFAEDLVDLQHRLRAADDAVSRFSIDWLTRKALEFFE